MSQALFDVFYVITALGFLSSVLVLIALSRFGSLKSSTTFLLFWFHGTLIAQEITTLPYSFENNHRICVAMTFLHYYFGLMNILVVAALVDSHRSSIFSTKSRSRQLILKYGSYVFVLFPMITLLPFFSKTYQQSSEDDDSGWCVLSIEDDLPWMIAVYLGWVWLFLLYGMGCMSYMLYKVLRSDQLAVSKLFSTISLYVLVAICSWIPRSLELIASSVSKNSSRAHIIGYAPIDFSGILYAILFFRERYWLMLQTSQEVQTLSFSWEPEEFRELADSMAHQQGPDEPRSRTNTKEIYLGEEKITYSTDNDDDDDFEVDTTKMFRYSKHTRRTEASMRMSQSTVTGDTSSTSWSGNLLRWIRSRFSRATESTTVVGGGGSTQDTTTLTSVTNPVLFPWQRASDATAASTTSTTFATANGPTRSVERELL